MPATTRAWVSDVVARSSTPRERRTARFAPLSPDDERAAHADQRLAHWQQRIADSDGERFARLLAWDGLDTQSARACVSAVRIADGAPLPTWAALLSSAVPDAEPAADRAASHDGAASHDRACHADTPLPFEEAILPFVRAARGRAQAAAERRAPSAADGLTPDAMAAFERVLLAQLTALAAPTLHAAFSAFRARRAPTLGIPRAGRDGRAAYLAFSASIVAGGWEPLFRRYPVLARLLATRATLWADALSDMLVRLAADRSRLSQTFADGAELGRVVHAEAGLSDPHRGGRSVSALSFASGLRVVYKPRDPGAERAFAEIVAWYNGRLGRVLTGNAAAPDAAADATAVHLRAPRVLVGTDGQYGWVEFVAAAPCADPAAVARYYRRAGALLALAYIIGAADLHSGNVIPAGEQPVLVDLEVIAAGLVLPGGAAAGTTPRGSAHRWRYWNSVLRTGLLPGRGVASGGKSYLEGGFAGGRASHPVQVRRWRHVNTDAMAPAVEHIVVAGAAGPTLAPTAFPDRAGTSIDAATGCEVHAHAGEVARGLHAGLTCIAEHRAEFAAGPLAALRDCQTRTVLRDTRVYDALLTRAAHPRFLTDGVEWSIELDVLRGPELRSRERPRLWDAWTAEQCALAQLDVPLFETSPASTGLAFVDDASGAVAEVFEESGYDAVRARLSALDAGEIARQLEFVRIALAAPGLALARTFVAASRLGRAGRDLDAVDVDPIDVDAPLAPRAAVAEALALGEMLRSLAAPTSDGSTWVGIVEKPGVTRSELQDVGYDLYSGRLGIAVFYAALARLTGSAEARTLAAAAAGVFVAPGAAAGRRADAVVDRLDIGGASGVGGVVYALTLCARLLDAPAFAEGARRAAAVLTPARIAADAQFDVMSGAAGAALGLIALHRLTPDPVLVKRAEACVEHLLAARATPAERGPRAWRSPDGRLLTGFGHGAAGIAYAVRTVGGATDRAAFFADAAEAECFVDAQFDVAAGNWHEDAAADRGGVTRLWCSWCHGAAGIGLGRLTAPGAPDSAALVAALTTADGTDFPAADHLCCGTLGRAELLCAASVAYDRPELLVAARRKAAGVVARAATRDGYVTGFAPEYAPAFFQGLSGVGYELLRLACPNVLPSVLLWQ